LHEIRAVLAASLSDPSAPRRLPRAGVTALTLRNPSARSGFEEGEERRIVRRRGGEDPMSPLPRIAAAGALALALAACGEKSKPDPYLQNVPDVAALTIDTSATAPTGVAAAGVTIVDPPMAVTNLQDDLGVVHAKAQAMNAALRSVFDHLEALRAAGGTKVPGDVKWFGPVNRCVEPATVGAGCMPNGTATLLLRVQLFGDHAASYAVVARPPSSTSDLDYKGVLAGFLVRGETDRRGAGKLWVNLPNLQAAASDFKGTGYFAAGFRAGPVAKAVTYRMLDFTRDPAQNPAVTAAFSAWKNGAGWVRARVAGFANLDKSGPAEELGFWRGVWAPGFGGRAFTVITDGRNPNAGGAITGDVPANQYWFGRACYPPGSTKPSYKEWFLCDKTVDGPPATCVQNAPLVAGSRQGAVDPSVLTSFQHWSQTTCYAADGLVPMMDRDQIDPPSAAAPGDGADDDSDEDGNHTGLLPEGCPTNVTDSNPDTTPR
jgi:hypothetical protein